jgi:hypothetical protein
MVEPERRPAVREGAALHKKSWVASRVRLIRVTNEDAVQNRSR